MEESLERALADLEIVTAAYPEEVTTNGSRSFPLQFTIHLTDNAFVTLEMIPGYPIETGVNVTSYRSKPHEKGRIEATVSAIRDAAKECHQDGVEGGFTCCSAALDTWNNYQQNGGKEDVLAETVMEQELITRDAARQYHWVSGECLVDRKSVFQAHLCRVSSEQQVREALDELISGSSKIQRATHNMVRTSYSSRDLESTLDKYPKFPFDGFKYAWRVSEIMQDGRVVSKHDNDDDGEDAAGSKLAYLLDVRKDENVLVVVSRWYGGIQLGPKRFAHIVSVARDLLVQNENS